jgi:putative membrane protein
MSKETSNVEQARKVAEAETDPRVDLAVERTELALERTQLAWIRTTLALLGSGIALDKGLEAMHRARIESGNALVQDAHFLGLSLSIAGTVLMIFTTWYYIRRSRSLANMKGGKPLLVPPGALASFLIILLGLAINFLLWVS